MSSLRDETPSARRATRLLGLGALLGLLATAGGLMLEDRAGAGLPSDVVAMVNGQALRAEQYERALAALASDRREPLGDTERRHVLDRLIEEELLVQRGLELGLARHDRQVRGDIVSAVIQSVVAQTEGYEPEAGELEAFYRENADYFARTPRLAVRQLLVRGPPRRSAEEARSRADQASHRLRAGATFAEVRGALGDDPIAPVPLDPLPYQKLREYLGPTASRIASELSPGEASDPIPSGTGWQVVVLVDRDAGFVPSLESVEKEVRAEVRRRAGDEALRDYLDELRDRAELVVTPLESR
jgi:parvulin-like peptidyl-prolyl isomerase